jgi:hypothetical protein
LWKWLRSIQAGANTIFALVFFAKSKFKSQKRYHGKLLHRSGPLKVLNFDF